jgi:hypothetical protein
MGVYWTSTRHSASIGDRSSSPSVQSSFSSMLMCPCSFSASLLRLNTVLPAAFPCRRPYACFILLHCILHRILTKPCFSQHQERLGQLLLLRHSPTHHRGLYRCFKGRMKPQLWNKRGKEGALKSVSGESSNHLYPTQSKYMKRVQLKGCVLVC